jgi:hypothetical protein
LKNIFLLFYIYFLYFYLKQIKLLAPILWPVLDGATTSSSSSNEFCRCAQVDNGRHTGLPNQLPEVGHGLGQRRLGGDVGRLANVAVLLRAHIKVANFVFSQKTYYTFFALKIINIFIYFSIFLFSLKINGKKHFFRAFNFFY